MFYKKHKPYTLCEHQDLPQCLVGSVLLILLVFSLVCLCVVCPRHVSCVDIVIIVSGFFISLTLIDIYDLIRNLRPKLYF